MPALSANEQILINGLLIGPGTSYNITSFNPWEAPDIASSDIKRGVRTGVVSGIDSYGAKRVSFQVIADGAGSKTTVLALTRAMRAAFDVQAEDVWLQFRLDGVDYQMRGRPRGAAADTKLYGRGYMGFDCRFVATDPRIYKVAASTSVQGLVPAGGSGIAFPLGFPLGFGVAASRSFTLTSNGTVNTPWSLNLTGWINDPYIINLTTGQGLYFSGFSQSNGWIQNTVIDSFDRTITRFENGENQGSYRRYLTSDSRWWDLAPGDNVMQIGAAASSLGGSFNFTWNDADL